MISGPYMYLMKIFKKTQTLTIIIKKCVVYKFLYNIKCTCLNLNILLRGPLVELLMSVLASLSTTYSE